MTCLWDSVEKDRGSFICVRAWKCDEPNIRQRLAREQTEMLAAVGNMRVATLGKKHFMLVKGFDIAIDVIT